MSDRRFIMFRTLAIVALASSCALSACSGGGSSATPRIDGIPGLQTSSSSSGLSTFRQVTGSNPYASAVLSSYPIVYYQLNDETSALVDSGPHHVNGTYGSSISHRAAALTQGVTSAAGFPGGSAYNAQGYAHLTPAGIFQPARVSVEAWVKLSSAVPAGVTVPVVVYGVARGFSYSLFLEGIGNNVARLYYLQRNRNNNNTLLLHGSTDLTVGIAYHIVTSFDGNQVSTYINGLTDVSASYPGSLGYSTGLTDGLQIGGAAINPSYGGYPSFPGTIAQVAVYGRPLTAREVVIHYLAGQLLPMIGETPAQADSFADSFGADVHFENNHSAYYTLFSQVASLLAGSGIRHFRDNMSSSPDFITQMKDLGNLNLRGTFITSLSSTASEVQGYPALVNPSLEQIEAPNEQDDITGHSNWEPGCIAFQKQLYSWVKGDRNISRYPVLGPGLAYAANYAHIGDLSGYMDSGNFHDYMGDFNPGFLGGPWNGMLAMIADAKVTSGSKPLISTEAGYGTAPGNPYLDNLTQLKYITRMFFEQFRAGVSRTYLYEFLDEPMNIGGFTTFGLLSKDLVAKPSFNAVKGMINTFADRGSNFRTTPLVYSLSGLNTVHHVLLQKRNGAYILALWLEVPSWNTVHGGEIAVPNQNVTLTTQNAFSTAGFTTMESNGNLSTTALPWNSKKAILSVSDRISWITLNP